MSLRPEAADKVRKRSARRWLLFTLLVVGLYAFAMYAAVSSLISHLGHHPKEVSIDAELVASIPGARAWAVPALLRELERGGARTKQNTLYALEFLHASYSEIGPRLLALLDDSD